MILVLTIIGTAFVSFIAIIIIANGLSWIFFLRNPESLLSQDLRVQMRMMDFYRGDLFTYVNEWFSLREGEWGDFSDEYEQFLRSGFVYEPFTEWKHRPINWKFIKVSENGFRHIEDQGPWPIDPENFNIFFFGGSTAFNFGKDETSIPSYLQKYLRKNNISKTACYNFGRGAYFSTQEKILFSNLLSAGHRPDMAVFLDGINDCYLQDGRTTSSDWLAGAWETQLMNRTERLDNATHAKPKWNKLKEFLSSLPLFIAIDIILQQNKTKTTQTRTGPIANWEMSVNKINEVIDRYKFNKLEIELLSKEYGVQTVFSWQPTPAYEYDLSKHIALLNHVGLGEHARAKCVYKVMNEMRHGPISFGWLAFKKVTMSLFIMIMFIIQPSLTR